MSEFKEMSLETDDRLEQRVMNIKQTLKDISSTLLDGRSASPAIVRPYTSTGFVKRQDFSAFDDPPLSSSRSNDLLDLKRSLDVEEGKNRRLEEKLRSMEETYQEMNGLMQELYRTIEEIQMQKQDALNELARLHPLEHQYDSVRKQVSAFQTTLSQKERLLSQLSTEHEDLLHQHDLLIARLQTIENGQKSTVLETGEKVTKSDEIWEGEIRRFSLENEKLRGELEDAATENHRLLLDLRRASQEETDHSTLRKRVLSLEKDIESICRDRDRLVQSLAEKEGQIRDLNGKIYEKELVAEAYKRPIEWVSHDPETVLPSLMNLLRLRSPEDIIPSVESILQKEKRGNSSISLMQKLGKLIQDCAPKEAGSSPPTSKQIWRWVRRLVEEYMTLKTRTEELDRRYGRIGEILGGKTDLEIVKAVEQVVRERNSLRNLEGKVKALVTDPASSETGPIRIQESA